MQPFAVQYMRSENTTKDRRIVIEELPRSIAQTVIRIHKSREYSTRPDVSRARDKSRLQRSTTRRQSYAALNVRELRRMMEAHCWSTLASHGELEAAFEWERHRAESVGF